MQEFFALDVPLTGFNLVEASAGTGKTFSITTLVLRQILEQGLGIEQIVAVTFTEAATAELRDRVRGRLHESLQAMQSPETLGDIDDDLRTLLGRQSDVAETIRRLEQALRDIDLAPIFTIHGFCARMIADSSFESGLLPDVRLLPDVEEELQSMAEDWWSTATLEMDEGVLDAVIKAKLQPQELVGLMKEALRAGDATILPDLSEASPVAESDELVRAIRVLGRVWDAETVHAKLSSGTLKRNSFKPPNIDRWVSDIEAWLSGGTVAEMPPGIEKLIPAILINATKKGMATPEDPAFVACEELLQCRQRYMHACSKVALKLKYDLVVGLRDRFWQRKLAGGFMTFDDQLSLLRDALRRSPHLAEDLRKRYPVALVDEFQDTNGVQWDIFGTIWAASNLFIIGDPKQAIYSFRGADIDTYLAARSQVPSDRCFTMKTNYRSDPSLVRAVNALFAGPRPLLHTDIGFPEVEAAAEDDVFEAHGALKDHPQVNAPLQFRFVPRPPSGKAMPVGKANPHVAQQVAAELVELLASKSRIDGRAIHAGDIAVLTRDNFQANEVHQALVRLGVPAVLLSQGSVFDSNEARELQRVLSAIVRPHDDAALRAALVSEFIGESASSLSTMRQGEDAGAVARWNRWLDLVRGLNVLWRERGFMAMYGVLVKRTKLYERMLLASEGERSVTNLSHLAELLHSASVTEQLAPLRLLGWLQERMSDVTKRGEEALLRLESDEHAVKICTIHKSKGLQFSVVYCPFLWKGMSSVPSSCMAYRNQAGVKCIELLSGDSSEKEVAATFGFRMYARARLEEEGRLCYVALTRAKHRCVVWVGPFSGFGSSFLALLLHARGEVSEMAEGGADAIDLKSLAAKIQAQDDDSMARDLDGLCERANGKIAWTQVEGDVADAMLQQGPDSDGPHLHCRTSPLVIDRSFRLASFSQLSESAQGRVVDARDHDAHSSESTMDSGEGVASIPRKEASPTQVPLASFPRGVRAGNFFHKVLEHLDFQATSEARSELVERTLRSHSFDSSWSDVCLQGLDCILGSDWGLPDEPGFRLNQLSSGARLDEFEFYFPVHYELDGASPRPVEPTTGQSQSSPRRTKVRPHSLAEVFERHPSPAVGAAYAARVRGLGFAPLRGFLKGFIDLIAYDGTRFYVVDYKSNHLGDNHADYDLTNLKQCMTAKHYVMQGHIYALALHRYLKWQLKDYSYAKDFGGIVYLFLRGMTGTSPGAGVYFEKPPEGRMAALDKLFAGSEVLTHD